MEEVRVYDIFICSDSGYSDDDVHAAVTKNEAKAEALVKALEDCGSEAYVLSRTVSASLKWVQELTE
jgi:hypothetical protein